MMIAGKGRLKMMKKKKNNLEIRDNPFPPVILDTTPTNLRVDMDPEADGANPGEEAAHQAKRWVDYNIK